MQKKDLNRIKGYCSVCTNSKKNTLNGQPCKVTRCWKKVLRLVRKDKKTRPSPKRLYPKKTFPYPEKIREASLIFSGYEELLLSSTPKRYGV